MVLSGNNQVEVNLANNEDMLFLLNENENMFRLKKEENSQNTSEKLRSIIRRYYNYNNDSNKFVHERMPNRNVDRRNYQSKYQLPSMQNSPMLIKLLRYEEL